MIADQFLHGLDNHELIIQPTITGARRFDILWIARSWKSWKKKSRTPSRRKLRQPPDPRHSAFQKTWLRSKRSMARKDKPEALRFLSHNQLHWRSSLAESQSYKQDGHEQHYKCKGYWHYARECSSNNGIKRAAWEELQGSQETKETSSFMPLSNEKRIKRVPDALLCHLPDGSKCM